MSSIGLSMIVKNETAVIRRCLDSVRPLVDYALIVDTGSTDGTQGAIRAHLAGIGLAGEVIDEPWRDFAYNRSIALAKLRQKVGIDYALVMDADDLIAFDAGFKAPEFKATLDKDYYYTEIRHGAVRFWRAQLLSNKVEFSYKGVLHEFLEHREQASVGVISGFHIEATHDGARSRDPNKYRDDAAKLQEALETETDQFIRARYTFYLGRCWVNLGEREKALHAFLQRAQLGGWNQEVCLSLYHAAQLKAELGQADSEVIGTFLKAYEAAPNRAEPLHGAMAYCRANNKPHQGYMIGKQALTLQMPVGALFVAPQIYDYGVLDEFAVLAYQAGHFGECLQAIERLLTEKKIPESEVPRLRKNAEVVTAKLKASPRQ